MTKVIAQLEFFPSSHYADLRNLKFIFIALALLNCCELNANGIKNLNEVRKNHFEHNQPLDTTSLYKYMGSEDLEVAKYAKGLLGVYFLENSNINGEKYWIDLATQTKWFKKKETLSEEMILFDDLFRICMVLKKYYFFQKILSVMYSDDLKLVHQTYNLYIQLRTGNIWNFLDNQTNYKSLFNSEIIHQIDSLDINVKERVLFNISAINFSNFDSVGINKFIEMLSHYESRTISDSSSFEEILFNLSLSNFKGDSTRGDNIARVNNKKILKHEYLSPFVASYQLENMPLLESIKKYLMSSISVYYNYIISNCIGLDEYFDRLLIYKINTVNKISILSTISADSYNESIDQFGENSSINKIALIDSIQSKNSILVEPAWLLLNYAAIYDIGNPATSINTILNSKYEGNIDDNIRKNSKLDTIYRANDICKCIDNVNVLHSLPSLITYVIDKQDSFIFNDIEINGKLDSIFKLLKFVKNVDYAFTGERTYFKDLIELQLQKYIRVLERILFIKREYALYEQVRKLDDEYYSFIANKRFNSIIYVATDKERYIAFKSIASRREIDKFDSIFVKTWNKEVAIRDSIIPYFKTLFFQSYIRDIIFDIHERKNISDSICASMIVVNDLLINVKQEGMIQADLNAKTTDSTYLINKYKNDIFCIDNTQLNTKKYVGSGNLNLEIFDMLGDSVDIKKRIDTTRSSLIYIIAEDLSSKELFNKTYEKSYRHPPLTIYGLYSSGNVRVVKRLASLDSLRISFDYNLSKSEQFYSPSFFSKLDAKAEILYSIFLAPFERCLHSDNSIILMMPASLNSIPLDYIYAQKNKRLPNFLEFGSFYKAAMKLKPLRYKPSDSAAIFSEMVYNDIYCNLNKSSNVGTRSGIAPLLNSRDERVKIEEKISARDYIGINASKENFISIAISNGYPIIHLITHGTYIPNYNTQIQNGSANTIMVRNGKDIANNDERQLLLFSSDSTKPTPFREKNNLLTAFETRYLEDLSKIKLIYLSACETGSIDVNEYSNSGYQGFVNNFLERGVKAVIATRWRVSDSYSVEFASKYYQNLTKVTDFQKAFYETKKYFFEKGTPPYLWTSYVFIQ